MFDSLLFSGKYQEAVEVVTVVTVTEVTVFLEGINVGIRELDRKSTRLNSSH